MTRPTTPSRVEERVWARFGALTAIMFLVGTTAAAVVMYPDANQDLAPRERLAPEALGILIAQAAFAATFFCGVQSILVAAVLAWWRSRRHSAVSQYLMAALAAVIVTFLTMLVIDRPWTRAPGTGWSSGWSSGWGWASSTAALAMYLAVIYCIAQALAFSTRTWRKAPTKATPA